MAGAYLVLPGPRARCGFQFAPPGDVARLERAAALAGAGGGVLLRDVSRGAHAGRVARARHAPCLLLGGIHNCVAAALVRTGATERGGRLGGVWAGAV